MAFAGFKGVQRGAQPRVNRLSLRCEVDGFMQIFTHQLGFAPAQQPLGLPVHPKHMALAVHHDHCMACLLGDHAQLGLLVLQGLLKTPTFDA